MACRIDAIGTGTKHRHGTPRGRSQRTAVGSRIDTEMEFEGQGGAEADFFFEPNEDGTTTVTWAFDTEHENVMGRWFGVMLDRMLGPDYEKGLTNLKRVAEG